MHIYRLTDCLNEGEEKAAEDPRALGLLALFALDSHRLENTREDARVRGARPGSGPGQLRSDAAGGSPTRVKSELRGCTSTSVLCQTSGFPLP